jgi:hypothetical protein
MAKVPLMAILMPPPKPNQKVLEKDPHNLKTSHCLRKKK